VHVRSLAHSDWLWTHAQPTRESICTSALPHVHLQPPASVKSARDGMPPKRAASDSSGGGPPQATKTTRRNANSHESSVDSGECADAHAAAASANDENDDGSAGAASAAGPATTDQERCDGEDLPCVYVLKRQHVEAALIARALGGRRTDLV